MNVSRARLIKFLPKPLRGARGNIMLGAMAAVTMSGVIGAAMVTYYETFVRQSRQVYVRSIMTTVDTKIRYLAMQPYAYICADQRAGATAADQLNGLHSCEINKVYFANVEHIIIDGACPPSAPCGLRLEFKTPVSPSGNPPLNFTTVTNPNTGESADAGLFPYRLVYEGKDFSLNPGGYDLTLPAAGMPVPREVLQSQAFDCAAANPASPVFGGFAQDGKPICRGFNECPTGQYGTSVSFRQLNGADLNFTCRELRTNDKRVNCAPMGQYKINHLRFDQGLLSSTCSELPVPDLGPPLPVPSDGQCGPSHGLTLAAAPTGGLCGSGTPSAVAGVGPWTWTCAGTNGGATANCQAGLTPGPCTGPNAGGGRFYFTAGSNWQVPCDWNNGNNTIEVIGGGGGGSIGEGGSGGGGAYSRVTNVTLTKGATLAMNVGAGGKGGFILGGVDHDGAPGGDSYLGGGSCASSVVCAKGGDTGYPGNSQGGQESGGVGAVKFSGGNGDSSSTSGSGGGGGAGPSGRGGHGGGSAGYAGGGGGGGGGGTDGANGGNSNGGRGGNPQSGGAGGNGGGPVSAPGDGTGGGGGGGGGGNSTGGGGADPNRRGGNGSNGHEWDGAHGSGGGGGGNGNNGGNAGRGGLYGAGGGGPEDSGAGGDGAQGIVVITYTP